MARVPDHARRDAKADSHVGAEGQRHGVSGVVVVRDEGTLSQRGGLTGGAGADVTLVTVEESVPDPDVCPCGGVPQLSLTHPTLKALDMKVQTEALDDHGCPLAQWLTTAGAQLLTTN